MKVLIADDNATNLKLLRALLEGEGHEVTVANDGIEALELLRKEKPEAVISDILMPRMDGYRLCQEMRREQPLSDIPFVFYTATYTSDSDEGLALKVGADAYLRKPARIEALIGAIEDAKTKRREHTITESEMTEFAEGQGVLREYSDALVRKLEQRNLELEEAHTALNNANEELEQRVRDRTAALEAANLEMEAFSHSVAHDLRSPLRSINGFCAMLKDEIEGLSAPEAVEHLDRIRNATFRMNDLIEELLRLSQIGRNELRRSSTDLSLLAQNIVHEQRQSNPNRVVNCTIQPGMVAHADRALLTIVLENLLGNAWKYTGRLETASVEVGLEVGNGNKTFFVKDNGAGFDMSHASGLFSAFKRMHTQREFPGTGLGLTIVHRIVTRHGGTIWAKSAPGEGATFFFTLSPGE